MRTTPIEGWQNIVLEGESERTKKIFEKVLEAEKTV
jgi:hypothetical protein